MRNLVLFVFQAALVLLLLLGGAMLLLPANYQAFWSFLDEEESRAEQQRTQELDRRHQSSRWRQQSKFLVVLAYEKRELSFLEAVAWFHRLNQLPVDAPTIYPPEESRSREELACGEFLGVLYPPGSSTMRGINTFDRRQAKFQELLDEHRPLLLPEPPPLPGMAACPVLHE